MKDTENVQQRYAALKANREKYMPTWTQIQKYTGINVNPDYMWSNYQQNSANALDVFVDDPTSAISVNQAGDYLIGIIWGTGDKSFNLVPSRYVDELVDPAVVQPWFDFATKQTLYHMNHVDAGFSTALRPYAYDQFSYGTSGIGVFPNKGFKNGVDENALVFRNYGVDSTCIDEGKNGMIEWVFPVHHWRTSRIVGEFCSVDGAIDDKKLAALPKQIRDAYSKNDFNQEFNIVLGVYPRDDFNPRLAGKRSARYCGVWFLDDATDNNIFYEEDFVVKPIAMCRQIKVRGEVYGRSSGTLLISTIRSVNFMVSTVIEILEKMGNPSLGVFNNAVFGDSVLDTSPNGLTVFNSALAGSSNLPMFPIHDVGDPTGIISFLIPYLNDKITTAFKVDALLDFNADKDMTATESLQRYAIRGKSLSGMLQQQKTELLEPVVKRSVSVLLAAGELGVDPNTQEARANALRDRNRGDRVIPTEVLEVMKSGRPWYEVKFNNELEKLTRTEAVQNLIQMLNGITGIAALYPQIVEAIDWYQMLKDINNNLDANSKIMLSADDFQAKIEQAAEMARMQMQVQAGMAGAQIQKDTSQANKNNQEAKNTKKI